MLIALGRTPEQIAEVLTDRIRSVYDLPCHFAATPVPPLHDAIAP